MEAKIQRTKRILLVAGATVAIVAAGAAALAHRHARAPALEGRPERLGYAIGLDLGAGARRQGIDVDAALVARGISDALANGPTLLSDEEARAALAELQGELRGKRLAADRELGARNKQDGDAFLARNRERDGVTTLASGLQYRVVRGGSGSRPTDGDVVECNYRGTRVDGTEFDSSARRDRPARFRVGALLPGWREALKLMPVGSRWELAVPPELAYGAQGPRNNVPPVGGNATLVYDVELLSIRPAGTAAASSSPGAAADRE
jgi:FKBP-type peptidyl-prolyl cis-trans isomerase